MNKNLTSNSLDFLRLNYRLLVQMGATPDKAQRATDKLIEMGLGLKTRDQAIAEALAILDDDEEE